VAWEKEWDLGYFHRDAGLENKSKHSFLGPVPQAPGTFSLTRLTLSSPLPLYKLCPFSVEDPSPGGWEL